MILKVLIKLYVSKTKFFPNPVKIVFKIVIFKSNNLIFVKNFTKLAKNKKPMHNIISYKC